MADSTLVNNQTMLLKYLQSISIINLKDPAKIAETIIPGIDGKESRSIM